MDLQQQLSGVLAMLAAGEVDNARDELLEVWRLAQYDRDLAFLIGGALYSLDPGLFAR
jgi:hypothetical protein